MRLEDHMNMLRIVEIIERQESSIEREEEAIYSCLLRIEPMTIDCTRLKYKDY